MKKILNYIVQGFGYMDINDLLTTLLKTSSPKPLLITGMTSVTLGSIREFIEGNIGLDIMVLFAFVFLIIAEWQTGMRVDFVKRGKRFKSRKFGRMVLKIGVYVGILYILYVFSEKTKTLEFNGFEINPMAGLYYVVFVGITLQLIISYFENLGNLGYKEAKGLVGIILRRFNKWFEFDGSSDGDDVFKNKE